jgi:trans-aconitate methyltransferase
MSGPFDKEYWESHWRAPHDHEHGAGPNPYLVAEADRLEPRTALDAGCGTGANAVWLARRGWQVTAVDISATALAQTREHDGVEWVEADLTRWEPQRSFDLVTTHYAHPAIPHLDFYARISAWVSVGGTLLVVGHRDDSVTAASVAGLLADAGWTLVTADEPDGSVVVRATR